MSITAIIVVFAVTWFMVFFIVLPIRFVSQAEAGSVVPGTPAGAPAEENVRRKDHAALCRRAFAPAHP